jgi:hypothetical protein
MSSTSRNLHRGNATKKPISIDTREQAEHEAQLDRERTEADEPQLGNLTPAEMAREEAEKAMMLADLRQTRPAKPGQERSAPESLTSRRITDFSEVAPEVLHDFLIEPLAPEPRPALLALDVRAELELVEQEVAALEAERKAAEQANAEQIQRLRADTDARLALIRAKRAEADRKLKDAMQDAAAVELAERAQAAQRQAQQNRERESTNVLEQRKDLASKLQPLIATAKQTLKEVRQLDTQHGGAIRKIAALNGWKNVNANWPVELRLKMQNRVITPAIELVRILNNCVRDDADPAKTIASAEHLLATWRPGDPVAQITHEVSTINPDLVRHVRNELVELNHRLADIEAQGAPYEIEPTAEVVVLLDRDIRLGLKEKLIGKYAHAHQQEIADGISDGLDG